jgi:hypothetical protein
MMMKQKTLNNQEIKYLWANLVRDWTGAAVGDRERLMNKERDQDGLSVQFEIDGLYNSLSMSMNFIYQDMDDPYPDINLAILQNIDINPVIDSWRELAKKQYPNLLKWVNDAHSLRVKTIKYLEHQIGTRSGHD